MNRAQLHDIELRSVDFAYADGEKIFNQVSFRFDQQEVYYLQGPRGSGKTTLMKILLGLNQPASGEYLINERNVGDFSFSDFDVYRLNMGYAFDVGGLINNLTLYENFKLVLDYHQYLPAAERYEYIINMMNRFDLDQQKHLRPAHVSGSSRKAANLLRAFLLHPQMLILNDPTQGLSPEHIPLLTAMISEYRAKYALKYVIISSDDLNLKQLLPGITINVTSNGLIKMENILSSKRAA